MAREEVTDRFMVQDEDGHKHRVTEITRYESGRTLDGGEVPTATYYRFDDGSPLEGSLGGDQFFIRNPFASYERVK